jgi:hypothetical protein
MGEALEVGLDLLRVRVDDAERLEDAVTALGAELADGKSVSERVDRAEGVGEGLPPLDGCRGIDAESEAPGHAASLRGGSDTPGACQRGRGWE